MKKYIFLLILSGLQAADSTTSSVAPNSSAPVQAVVAPELNLAALAPGTIVQGNGKDLKGLYLKSENGTWVRAPYARYTPNGDGTWRKKNTEEQ